MIATGLEKFTCCHPEAVSLVNVAVASSVTVLNANVTVVNQLTVSGQLDPNEAPTRTVSSPFARSITWPGATVSTPTDAATATSTGRLNTSWTAPTCLIEPGTTLDHLMTLEQYEKQIASEQH